MSGIAAKSLRWDRCRGGVHGPGSSESAEEGEDRSGLDGVHLERMDEVVIDCERRSCKMLIADDEKRDDTGMRETSYIPLTAPYL